MSTTNRQFAFIAVILLLCVFSLAACGGSDSERNLITLPSGAQAGDLTLEPCTYEAGDIVYRAECGTLVVPENRGTLNSQLIALPLIRIPATGSGKVTSTLAEPIFWFNGGPGLSNMRFSHPQDLAALLEEHDFILVGYRGVDGSVVLDCPEISQALGNPPGDLLSDASLESYGAAAARCAARLQVEGVDLAGYTMTETIDDVEAAREALGYERINLLATSYGTRLALLYEWLYPDSLRRVVMTGVNPPGSFIWEANVIDGQIEDYARLCAQDAGCRARTIDLASTMRQVAHNVPERWLLVPIDEDKVKLITFIMLTESIRPPGDPIGVYGPAAVDMWLAAAEGDTSGLALASMSSNLFLPDFYTWGHTLAMGGGTGEYADSTRDYKTELDPPNSILGAPMSLLMWGMGTGWPVNPIPEAYHQVQASDVETLMQGGSIDFMNPPQAATEKLVPYLSHGQQVILKEFGHGNTFWNSQAEARLHLLTTFYDSGQVDTSLYTYQPLDFEVGGGWPGLAKTLLSIVLVIIVLLAALVALLVWFAVRMRRKRRDSVGQVEA